MNDQDNLQRTVLPIPDQPRKGLVTYDAKDPETKYPKITPLLPPKNAPNVLIVLIDDAGFGSSSAFGGPCNTPVAEALASLAFRPGWDCGGVGSAVGSVGLGLVSPTSRA